MKYLLANVRPFPRRLITLSVAIGKQLPKTDPAYDSQWRHPKTKGNIRYNRPYRHRPEYQKTEAEVLFDQITQPHFPSRIGSVIDHDS